MTPEYKFYHGAVLAELVDRSKRAITIDELTEYGRLSSYVLNGNIGIYVKHSAQRLHPWPFTFTRPNLVELLRLQSICDEVFLVLVCEADGMVCLAMNEAVELLQPTSSDQAWLRVDRKRGEWYAVASGGGGLPYKRPKGIDLVLRALDRPDMSTADGYVAANAKDTSTR